MLSAADSSDMATTHESASNVSELAELDSKETEISTRRRDLHRQIDGLYLRAPLGPEDIARLDLLENQERDLSAERRLLHARINALRCEIGLLPWSEGHELGAA
jgi:hypothetical protein